MLDRRSIAVSAVISLSSGLAAAEATPAYKLFEDGALGMKLPEKRLLGTDKGLDKALTDCIMGAPRRRAPRCTGSRSARAAA